MTSYCAMKFAVRGLTQAVGKQSNELIFAIAQ